MILHLDQEQIDLTKLDKQFQALVTRYQTEVSYDPDKIEEQIELCDELIEETYEIDDKYWSEDGETFNAPYSYTVLMEHIIEGGLIL